MGAHTCHASKHACAHLCVHEPIYASMGPSKLGVCACVYLATGDNAFGRDVVTLDMFLTDDLVIELQNFMFLPF